jgi:hypothetical protein
VKRATSPLRAIALLAAGSAAVHQTRYTIGYGTGAGRELAAHGHGYLTIAMPLVVAAVIFAMAVLLLRIARGRPAHSGGSLAARWVASSSAIALVFAVQESLEGAGAVANGGWIGLVLALPAGLLVALALRGASAAEPAAGPGPLVGFTALLAAPASAAPTRHCGRIASRAGGARAPPLPSVV